MNIELIFLDYIFHHPACTGAAHNNNSTQIEKLYKAYYQEDFQFGLYIYYTFIMSINL